MTTPIRGLLLVLPLLGAAATPGAGQCCQPRPTITFNFDEVVAGAAGNAILRGPWLTAPWRRPLPRAAVFTLGSFVYERFVDHGGWSWSDFNQRLVSYALTEAVVGGVQWLRRKKTAHRPPDEPALLASGRRNTCRPGLGFERTSTRGTASLEAVSRLCELQRRW
ncbi:MAG TPA: hypothetical protein VM716_09645 [Gemmatimonadales bacterium]|nr:hypothetical protein [Gemmatimonadales bacterium]